MSIHKFIFLTTNLRINTNYNFNNLKTNSF